MHGVGHEQGHLLPGHMMAGLGIHKLGLQHLAIVKPFLIYHITVQVIVKNLHRIIFLVIEDEGFIIRQWVVMKMITNDRCQALPSLSHIRRDATDIEAGA